MRYTTRDLIGLPDLAIGQADSLKVDDGTERVWLSRCTVADGEPYNNKITVERLREGRWITVSTYRGGAAQ